MPISTNQIRRAILLAALTSAAYFAKAQTPTPPTGAIETYKVVNGMNIRATVSNIDDGRRHRVVITIHEGGYKSGGMETAVAQELSQYGFMGVGIEYRLAPPHIEMNTPDHPFPGQNDIHDDGYYPEQTEDVGDAIIHYRNDSRSNGEVVAIGGSAGGSHALYLSATGTPGYDMPDLAVLLSCGVSNLADPNQWPLECILDETCPHQAIANYLDIPDPAPLPPIGSELELAQDASPTQSLHIGMCPFWAMCSSEDSLGIPTSTGFNIYSYLPNNRRDVLENGENGIVPTALAIGIRESTATVPEAESFKATILDVPILQHAFQYWDQVKSEVIPWISAPIPPTASATPTPTVPTSPTPSPTLTPNQTPTPTPGQFVLTASGRKIHGFDTVNLSWSGATSATVDIYRNGAVIATVPNTPSDSTDNTGQKGQATFTYEVCEAGTQNCSNQLTVSF